MYLKRLEMLGFKSFANKTVLEFNTGITAVVGPNGAGKSNVADAVRWVLGEQSMRQLRGKKSEDIIFLGGQGRAAQGLAEVSLTIDNSTGWVPSEYSEIMVTRRCYRSGENEYLINKQKVRLKDVLLLLAQARIGHDTYTVVGQGLIDAALSLRAEERRALFEEAAGIRPYQVQRTDAEHRLSQTEQNLDRIRDIVNEIEPRLEPLAEQAQRATEYSEISHSLQKILLHWYELQWQRLQLNREHSAQQEQIQAQQLQQAQEQLQQLSQQAEESRSDRQHLQTRLTELRLHAQTVRGQVQQFERELAVVEERLLGLHQQRSMSQQEELRFRERLIALQRQLIDLEEQCELSEEQLDQDASQLAHLETQNTQAQKEYEQEERYLRNAQKDLVQAQARLGVSQAEERRLQQQISEKHRTLTSRRDLIAQAQQSAEDLESRLQAAQVRLQALQNEEQQASKRKQGVLKALGEAQQEIERLKQTINEAERQRRTVNDRLQMLKKWRQDLSGYSDGVRALLKESGGQVTGVLGPVPQLGIVAVGLELAFENALGPSMQALVVRTLVDAQRSLSYLQQNQAGKAQIIWMEREGEDEEAYEVSDLQGQVERDVLFRFVKSQIGLQERVLGFAWQHVQFEPPYRLLWRRLLRGIVLVHDREAAQILLDWVLPLSLSSDVDLPLQAVVTLQGEMLHVDGWLRGGNGSRESSSQGLLAYERELKELPSQLNESLQQLELLQGMFSQVQRTQEGRRIEQIAIDKELHNVSARLLDSQKLVLNLQHEQGRLQTELQLAIGLEQQLSTEIAALEQESQLVQERIQVDNKAQAEFSELVDHLQYEADTKAQLYRHLQDSLGKTRTALAVKRQEAKIHRQQLVQQQIQADDLKSQVAQHVTRLQEFTQREQEMSKQQAEKEQSLEQLRAQLNKQESQLQQEEATQIALEQTINQQEQKRRQVQQLVSEQEGKYRRVLLESQKARDAVETFLEQLQEELGFADPAEISTRKANSIPETPPADEDEEAHLRRLRRQVEQTRNRLKMLGGCDLNAPQLYKETKTRYDFLHTQIIDMEQAALRLRSIISQLDGTMARQFETTFQAVSTRFREHFTTLFHGGSARLELINSQEKEEGKQVVGLPAGVDVIVQPPGKKVQDLSLLSGGERALVSAALLFALLEINPPPFCMLDEVDAALDESNVTRFCDILKQLAQRTQFIVITHNRVTMTSAQAIYGVSMRDSVSRLLSLLLEEVS